MNSIAAQRPGHQVNLTDLELDILDLLMLFDPLDPLQVSLRLDRNHSSVANAMRQLHRHGVLSRERSVAPLRGRGSKGYLYRVGPDVILIDTLATE